ncbi:MAG: cyclopropane-fatty-acyl-phospholipid synthase family protein [Gammaproteobacteria bacterium]|nr:cyclopropane-fatty-acyl-phospholipid synthase family protein [Gammaproteobacteria bacterium]MDH3446512.1 cyclopropane-fatty-acyl-phospholipid synthase family protein [Gammaproteobacteria bacterium]
MNTVNTSAVKTSDNPGWLGNFAKSQLLKRLQQLPRGYLLIEDGDDLFSFGDPENHAGIKAKIVIKDTSAYRDIAFGGSIGGAEAYMLDKWTTPNLVEVVRLMSINIDFLNEMDDAKPLLQRIGDKLFHWLNRNTEKQARQNIASHYDLSNDFFALFLDPEMMYSAAIFPHPDADLDEAAIHKLDVICRKLDLQPGDHLLEIGTGWGGLAIYAAKHYGCRVTTTTISKEQFDTARDRVQAERLEQQVEVLFEDYRNLTGRFDKLVSIEMIEAVGHEYYKQYFSGCAALLKDDGLMLLQAITVPDQRFEYAQKSVDFIQRYIFPGGSLPSHEAILSSVKKNTDMLMIEMQEIGEDYARTIEIWRERFMSKLDQVRALGFDDYFIRMWNYYLCYCQGGFEERVIGTSQMLFAKPDWRKTSCS